MTAQIGVIGGSGLYSLIDEAELVDIETEFGDPSSQVALGKIGDKDVAFIARHGPKHTIPPHKVPYKANVAAFDSLGVKRIISSNAAGSLSADYKPGDFVLMDQFFNMTNGRDDTFFNSDSVVHISTAEPYCPGLRARALAIGQRNGLKMHEKGTVVVINGPRFSTKAESRVFSKMGFELVNMTQYPEIVLAREKKMCYLGIGIITDYDVGLEGMEGVEPVTFDEVSRTFAKNIENVKVLISDIIKETPVERKCNCGNVLDGAVASTNRIV